MVPPVTGRLILRPFSLEDAPFILRLLNEPSFIQNIADKGVRTLEQAENYLQHGPMASYAAHGHGLWMVQHRESTVPMGMCGLIKRENLPALDLGYAFLPEWWGQGFAREAAQATLDWGVHALGLRRVLAVVSPGNTASIRLLDALGFRYVETMEWTPGDPVRVFEHTWD